MQCSGNTDSKAQNHQDTMFPGSAYIHSKKIQINQGVLRDTMLPLIKLPHIKDNKKWAYLNEIVTEALNVGLPTWKIMKNDINKVVNFFETLVYQRFSSECGTVDNCQRHPKRKPPPRLLQRLINKKRELRRQFRKLKRQSRPDMTTSALYIVS